MQITSLLKINLYKPFKVFSEHLLNQPRFANLPGTSENQGFATG
jgi:hypothetical protein